MTGLQPDVQRALRFIQRRGHARTPDLARELGLEEAAVDALFAEDAARAHVVTCAVELGEGRRVVEYRLSAVGGGRIWEIPYSQQSSRGPDPVKERLREWGTPPQPKTAPQPPRAATPAADKGEPKMGTKEKIVEAFTKKGPMRLAALKDCVDAGYAAIGSALNLGFHAKPKVFEKLGGGPRSTIWGLPGQTAPAQAEKPDALERGAELGRRRGTHGKRRGRKGRVKRTSRIPVAGTAARKAWDTRRRNGEAAKGFRPALAADGALVVLGGDVEFNRDETRTIVRFLRTFNEPQIVALRGFIGTLDKAEIAA